MAIGFGEVTMQGALGTTFSTLAAQKTAKALGAPASSVPKAQGPQGNILKPAAPALGVPVGGTYASSVGRTKTTATSSNATRVPSASGQPPIPAPATAPTPPIALPPPPEAVELPPLEGSPVAALVAPPSMTQPGIPSSLPSEGVAFVQSSAPRSSASEEPLYASKSNTLAYVAGAAVVAGLAWYFLRS